METVGLTDKLIFDNERYNQNTFVLVVMKISYQNEYLNEYKQRRGLYDHEFNPNKSKI